MTLLLLPFTFAFCGCVCIRQISYASVSPILSDKSAYPRFFRTSLSELAFNAARVALMKEFSWTHAAIIYDSRPSYGAVLNPRTPVLFQGAVALTIGSVRRRIVPKVRHFHWLLKMNAQLNRLNLGTILYGTYRTVSATAPSSAAGTTRPNRSISNMYSFPNCF